MKSNPVVHFEIYVNDMSRAKAFYEAVLEPALKECPIQPLKSRWICGLFQWTKNQG